MKTFVLLLVLFTSVPTLADATNEMPGAIRIQQNILKCDKLWSDQYFGQLERKDYPECVSRWTWLTNREKAYFRNH